MLEDRPAISIDALNHAARSYLRGVLMICGISFALAVAGAVIAIENRDAIRSWYTKQFGAPAAEGLVGVTPFLPAIVAIFAGIYWVERKRGRNPSLLCPHCRRNLMQMRHLVIASRNCPYCGKRVVEEPSP